VAFENSLCGRALSKPLCLCMRIICRKTVKQTCGSRTEAMQKNSFNSLAPVIPKIKRNVACASEKVAHPCCGQSRFIKYENVAARVALQQCNNPPRLLVSSQNPLIDLTFQRDSSLSSESCYKVRIVVWLLPRAVVLNIPSLHSEKVNLNHLCSEPDREIARSFKHYAK